VEERLSIGTAEVKAVFGSGNRKVAGCLVTDGTMRRDAIAVVKRGKRVVAEVRGSEALWEGERERGSGGGFAGCLAAEGGSRTPQKLSLLLTVCPPRPPAHCPGLPPTPTPLPAGQAVLAAPHQG